MAIRVALVLLVAAAQLSCGGVRRGRQLLGQGRPQEALSAARPVSAPAFVVRARALRRLGRLRQARTELLLALSLDRRSADALAVLGRVEAQLGNRGAAVAALERALRLDPTRACLRRELARLLVWRAWYRIHPGPGLNQVADARAELERVRELDPCLHQKTARIFEKAPQISQQAALPDCPGVPALPASRLPWPGPCSLRDAGKRAASLLRRELLVGCRGAALALELEAHGCVAAAGSLWEALSQEAPNDARWPLQVARALILQGHEARSEALVMNHVFLSEDRASALNGAARMLEAVGKPRRAARRAVEALAHAKRLEQQLDALRILARTGAPGQLRQAMKVVEKSGWDLPGPRLRRLMESATTAAPQKPRP